MANKTKTSMKGQPIKCPECASTYTLYRKRDNNFYCRKCGCGFGFTAAGRRLVLTRGATVTT
jgi:ribosomal protein S27E